MLEAGALMRSSIRLQRPDPGSELAAGAPAPRWGSRGGIAAAMAEPFAGSPRESATACAAPARTVEARAPTMMATPATVGLAAPALAKLGLHRTDPSSDRAAGAPTPSWASRGGIAATMNGAIRGVATRVGHGLRGSRSHC